ncbi:MAG: N-acetylglucosamine-6-phosphate deacetylase [Ruminococcaceae bacterium]|nr:N-acetylglucosamine-6-phosphate deacetylase [Oscillospiraceae bacterium]
MKYVAFVGGMVFNSHTERFERANIVCRDGYIVDIGSCFPSGYERIDVTDKYLIPGLIDVHTHGIAGGDFNYASENKMKRMCQAYAKNGTTSIMATLASQSMTKLFNSIYAINQNRLNDECDKANILGIHMEGRYLNPKMRGAHSAELLALPSVSELCSLFNVMMPAPAHFSLAPELEGAHEFIKKAKELGATVGIAHTSASYEEALEALNLGATSFTHTFNAMTPIHHRMPGAAVCSLNSKDAYTEIICDGIHMHPAMVQLAYNAKPKDKLVLITDSMSATAMEDGEYQIAGSDVIVKDGRAVNKEGVLAGSTLTLFKALTNMMEFCGITLNEALKFATTNPAKMVGADFVGSLEKNYRADLIVLNDIECPKIYDVYVGGNKII